MTKEERIESARCLKESGNKLFSVSVTRLLSTILHLPLTSRTLSFG